MEYSLVMIFKTTSDKKFTISIDGVKENINDIEVNNIMDELINRNIIKTSKGFLSSKYSSYILQKIEKPFIMIK